MKQLFRGMKLDIGAGNPEEGNVQAGSDYLLQDVEAHQGIDVVCDIRDLEKVIGENLCSEIRASHVLEHFHKDELNTKLLPMLRRCLDENGILNIIVPNFEWHCDLVKQGQDEIAIQYAFGNGVDKYDHHYTGWTPRLAHKWVSEAGFEIDDFYVDTCVHIKAIKK
jgi:predicted SAM-dependent methyltransferase